MTDFNREINRYGTDCIKYDYPEKYGKPKGLLPMWVADMDFDIAEEIKSDLRNRVEHGIMGYSDGGDEYFNAVKNWMIKRHDYEPQKEWLVVTPGVVFALSMAVRAFTEEGEGVLIQRPVYYPFSNVIKNNGRKIINNPLILDDEGHYTMDFEDLENKIRENKVRLMFLCSPHNPVGRVWKADELKALGEIAIKYDLVIVCDEIHHDLIHGNNRHIVFSNVSEEISDRTILCTAPSKSFNLAGLQASNIFIKNTRLRRLFKEEVAKTGYGSLNAMAIVGVKSAYEKGEKWFDEMLAYIGENIRFLDEFLEKRIPKVKLIKTEGTYLAWVDFRGLSISDLEVEQLISKAGLWLDGGTMFGKEGECFQRFNIACPKKTLKEALLKLEKAIKEL